MPNRKNIVWYTDGQYQGGTIDGCDSVNLFHPDTKVIAVYEKRPDGSNLFLTTCKLTDDEITHLKLTNGNFVTQKILDQQKEQNGFNKFGKPIPITDGIKFASPMEKNSSPNPGFTPINTFESDVMGISPLDNSHFNNP